MGTLYGFQTTDLDVEAVLQRCWGRVASTGGGRTVDVMAGEVFLRLDLGAIERAALDQAADLEEQTDAAHGEIERQLITMGVLRPPELELHLQQEDRGRGMRPA